MNHKQLISCILLMFLVGSTLVTAVTTYPSGWSCQDTTCECNAERCPYPDLEGKLAPQGEIIDLETLNMDIAAIQALSPPKLEWWLVEGPRGDSGGIGLVIPVQAYDADHAKEKFAEEVKDPSITISSVTVAQIGVPTLDSDGTFILNANGEKIYAPQESRGEQWYVSPENPEWAWNPDEEDWVPSSQVPLLVELEEGSAPPPQPAPTAKPAVSTPSTPAKVSSSPVLVPLRATSSSVPTTTASAAENCLDPQRCTEIDAVWLIIVKWINKAHINEIWNTVTQRWGAKPSAPTVTFTPLSSPAISVTGPGQFAGLNFQDRTHLQALVDESNRQGIDPCFALVTVKHESSGRADIVGNDVNFVQCSTISRRKFLLEKSPNCQQIYGGYSSESSAKLRSDCNQNVDNACIVDFKNLNGYSLKVPLEGDAAKNYFCSGSYDTSYTYGIGLGQITPGIGSTSMTISGLSYSHCDLFNPQKNIQATVSALKVLGADSAQLENQIVTVFSSYSGGAAENNQNALKRYQDFQTCKANIRVVPQIPGLGCKPLSYSNSEQEAESKLVQINLQGKSILVHEFIAPLVIKIDQEITASGIHYSILDIGSYAWRCVNKPGSTIQNENCDGTSRSKHSYGIAIDINPTTNPYCTIDSTGKVQVQSCIPASPSNPDKPYDLPQQIIEIFKRNDFAWGGDWPGAKDFMHFEWNGNAGDFNGDGVVESCPGSTGVSSAPVSSVATSVSDAVSSTSDFVSGIFGSSSCPEGMANVNNEFCIDKYEGTLVNKNTNEAWSPYINPIKEINNLKAVSVAGVVPQGYIGLTHAAQACQNAGKKLCTDAQWLQACAGSGGRRFPYGNEEMPGACNYDKPHPNVKTGDCPNCQYSMEDPLVNQKYALAKTGAYNQCVTPEEVYDLTGNLQEWVDDGNPAPNNKFGGGYYGASLLIRNNQEDITCSNLACFSKVQGATNIRGCGFQIVSHTAAQADYSLGFRCCATLS